MTAAKLLADKYGGGILLVDEFDQVGGNHISLDIGPRSYDIGSFFFYDGSPFLQLFPEIRPLYKEIGLHYVIQRITPTGAVAQYPFDPRSDLFNKGKLEIARVAASVFWSRLTTNQNKNAGSYAQYWLGKRFTETTGLYSYLQRFYGKSPEEIESQFARKRMSWIEKNSRLRNAIRMLRGRKFTAGNSSETLVRPREGFHILYNKVAENLRSNGVDILTGVSLENLQRKNDGCFELHICDPEPKSFKASEVLSTIPVNNALSICGFEPSPTLQTATLTSLFYSFSGKRGFDANVLYNFSETGKWKRLTVMSDFYGKVDDRHHFTVEVIRTTAEMTSQEADADFRSHIMEDLGLLSGDLILEGARVTENAYPVYTEGAEAATEAALAKLRNFGIMSFGRQGGFDYQPTASVSTQVAADKVSRD